MKFSLLIANFNNGKFFRDCYDSIILQKYSDWEAIILDDGSSDDSVNIIKELIKKDPRFRLFQNDKNKGVCFTKKKLIELAEGDICGYIDPDDALGPDAVQNAIHVFKKNEEIVLSYSKFIQCDENLKPLSINKSSTQVVNGDPYFFNCPIQIVHFVAFRKSIYLECEKTDADFRIAEDQDLYLKMYEKGKVKHIDSADYFYRAHAGGISQNENKQSSYEYWAKVIWFSMKRRGLNKINGKNVPTEFTSSQEIFHLLAFQNSIFYRIIKKVRLLFQKVLDPL